MAKIVAIVNQKGGVGKTTSCVNLAAALKAAGQRILLCDFDPQANATSGMGVDKTVSNGIYDVLINSVETEKAIVRTSYGDVLPSSKALAGASVEMIDLPERQFNLSHSGPYALCALDRRPVGVDIQTVGPHRPRILQRVYSREERAWLDEQSDLWAAFAQLWALKESRAKYTGAGLTSTIAEIRVPLPAPGVLTLDGLHFRVYSGPGWRAAACGESPPPEEILWKDV